MTYPDWIVIFVYVAGIVIFAVRQSKSQHDISSYYLADRTTKWWQSGLSTMATQLGAISFVSAPAFVAVKEGGGLKWLCYEFGVPLGILVAAALIIPTLHKGGYISIYEYLEVRYDRSTRTLISILFQLGRGLASAVSILAGGIILSTVLPFSVAQAIILVGVITLLYDVIGGIRVVIASDVVQMTIIQLGVVICGASALYIVGWSGAWDALGAGRSQILDFAHPGFTAAGEYSFWPMTIGGMFLYASYYGCDQSQVQREMSVESLGGVRKSLLLNAFGRFPVVLMYCLMGVFVGALFSSPEHLGSVAAGLGKDAATVTSELQRDPDRMLPMFILAYLPPGVVGLILVAIMSALMSSLDSAINSLSAVTVSDFYQPYIRPSATERHYLIASKLITLFWGVFCVAAALVFASVAEATRQTTIVLINAVGSVLYGPILGAFVLGITTRGIGGGPVKLGVVTGVAVNIVLWQLTSVSWMWWNAAGFLVTLATAFSVQYWRSSVSRRRPAVPVWTPRFALDGSWRQFCSLVLLYTLGIVLLSLFIQFSFA
jgi:sodium-dependent multivitamin transporter 6